jgi:2-haloacid dehalogenase
MPRRAYATEGPLRHRAAVERLIALPLNMAKCAGLPWDAILGAEVAQAYKPTPESYLRTADILALRPDALCLVAAHNSDLAAARSCGFKTLLCRVRPSMAHGRLSTFITGT